MSQTFGTKAETLALLQARGFVVPPVYYFEAAQWQRDAHSVLAAIECRFIDTPLAVRSSAHAEDTDTESLAGAFHSVLHVPCAEQALRNAIEEVIARFNCAEDQVLVQPMLSGVQIAGVIMTRTLDDGSPYYVFNYDDVSGRTDTVTGGSVTAKTVHVYNGVSEEDFDSPRLREVLRLVRNLERVFTDTPLDIEFAVDDQGQAWLLQVRPICTLRHWKKRAASAVSARIQHVERYVCMGLRPRPGFYGRRTVYGIMPDWNPAEIIGLVPRPLAFSLYRDVITRSVWSEARANMGYHAVPAADLMISIAGRPYIDVRASFNSLLPAALPTTVAEKLVNAWLDRLDAHPELHDKVEFDIVPTVLDFDTEALIGQRYPQLLSPEELNCYIDALRTITQQALEPEGSLQVALATVRDLHASPLPAIPCAEHMSHDGLNAASDCVLQLPALLADCRQRGTLPFAIAARHAFMAESLLRSAVRCGALSQERLNTFKRAVPTVSGELSRDFAAACADATRQGAFLRCYGHLRPGTYDILSPHYAQREDLFSVREVPPLNSAEGLFTLEKGEQDRLSALLQQRGLHIHPQALFDYARTAIAGREYAKFVFTRHISHILELIAAWGQCLRLSRAQVAMLPLESILETLFTPLPSDMRTHFLGVIRQQQHLHALASSFKLAQLIRSPRDVYIAPMHRAAPNFITSCRVAAPVTRLSAEDVGVDLAGKIVCIESADPGYDWIFTRNIAGLITRFGGTNSHMAIRCAEYGLPAAIGCGTLLFEKTLAATACILDCGAQTLHPLGGEEEML